MMKKSSIFQQYNEVLRYLVVGGFTTLVSLLVYYLCVYTFLNPNEPFQLQIANIIAWIVSVTFAYLTNRFFVFKSRNKNKVKESFSFYLSRLLTLLFDMVLMFILVTCINVNDKLAKLIVQVVIIVLNYIISKKFVFKKTFM